MAAMGQRTQALEGRPAPYLGHPQTDMAGTQAAGSLCSLSGHCVSSREKFAGVESLLDLSAKVAAAYIPFQRIEERYNRIPEPVQRRIIFWSFPRNERDICMYSSLSADTVDYQKLPFYKGLKLYECGYVENVLQVGFHLSGVIAPKSTMHVGASSGYDGPERRYRISISFDRCKITAVTCTCDSHDIFWCQHVVALAIYRIRNAETVKLRVPISETLLQMSRDQLQKMLQYLIAEHHTAVLPSAQRLADELRQNQSVINQISGAPDPTAGGAADDENVWHLDEGQVSEQVRTYLNQGGHYHASSRPLGALFGKVKEMLRARDGNGARMLRLITEQFLDDPRLVIWRAQGTPMTDKCRQLWDQLGALWVCIVLNPHCTGHEKAQWREYLMKWSMSHVCPLEDADFRPHHHHHNPHNRHLMNGANNVLQQYHQAHPGHHRRHPILNHDDLSSESSSSEDDEDEDEVARFNPAYRERERQRERQRHRQRARRTNDSKLYQPRSIFHRALESWGLSWDDPHLRYILSHDGVDVDFLQQCKYSLPGSSSSVSLPLSYKLEKFNTQGYPLWHEHIPTACSRVEALRSHGYRQESLRLAVAIVRTWKRQQNEWKRWEKQNSTSNRSSTKTSLPNNADGWIGHPLNPVGSLFDTLAEASLLSDSKHGLEYFYESLYTIGTPSSQINSNQPPATQGHQVGNEQQPPPVPAPAPPPPPPPPPQQQQANNNNNINVNLINGLVVEGPGLNHPVPVPPLQQSAIQQPAIPAPQAPPREKPKYHHVPVPGSSDSKESYLSLAVEAALIGLGQQRCMPLGVYAQEKAGKQEENMITKLQDIESDPVLITVLREQASLLLECGPFSGLGEKIHPESVPMHKFAHYLFNALLQHDPDLAYAVGLRAMRLPIQEDPQETEDFGSHSVNNQQPLNNNNGHQGGNVNNNNQYNNNNNNNGQGGNAAAPNMGPGGPMHLHTRHPRWFTLPNIEAQQCALASTMLSAAKNDILRLRTVLKAAQKNIHSSTQLFKLAQDAFRIAVPQPPEGPVPPNTSMGQTLPTRHLALLNVSFELGLQVLRVTLNNMNNWRRRDMVRWLVTCATEIGLDALISILVKWNSLFAPQEATKDVAAIVMSHATIMRLGLDYQQQEELSSCARTLALQCASKDPPSCALSALQLCENDRFSFEKAYDVVVDAAATGVIASQQLFNVARYMDHRGYQTRAYKLGLLGMKGVHVQYNQDSHTEITNIHWVCALAHSLGRNELTNLVPLLVKNVQCANVLSDILKRCSLATPSIAHLDAAKRRCVKPLSLDRPPLRPLLEAAISAYINTTHSRLTHISPRHYGDFIEFLSKARETFLLAHDGHLQFNQLIENMKVAYKGKKKLMFLVKERFG